MKIKKIAAIGAAIGVVVAGIAFAAPANAEPVSNSYVLVGSDTLQDSVNALTNGTSVGGASLRVTAGGASVGSFDAFGSTSIQTKPGGPYFGRPSGSGAGVTALRASINGAPTTYSGNAAVPAKVIGGQVDIARSSSGPGANANSAGKLVYVPYARDAVAYAYNGSSADLGALSKAQLKQIYESNTPVTIGGTVVHPVIPQASSGTRSFFLSSIGVTTLGSTVNDVNNTTPENDASVLPADSIIPFSAASWIAQSNGVTGVSTIGSTGVKLGSPDGVAPFTGTTTLAANSAFYGSSYGRDTYLVVEFARVDSSSATYDKKLADLVDSTKAQSLTNFGTFSSTSGAVKAKFGFLAPSSTAPIRAFATI
ncbi:substrate-binding domain-containing protein [Subtercola endophyticus]|uniref:substrate-binding domain-containing protein n=1 Tax=Subtercola endophyticus TaxID=2895559 RepID=UPI001E56FE32|nr:substrate-binding domain-containing protein [Subtercola endophyticus]UFS59215.1 substrate-binding domain-containing protein [Subtercola endophyticus]